MKIGETLKLNATVLPEDATDKSMTWSSSDHKVAKVDGNGLVTSVSQGTSVISALANDGSGQSANCIIYVEKVEIPLTHFCPDNNHPHVIDLGIGLRWCCCNVGASVPWEFGMHYAWGETVEKSDYSWETYKYWRDDDDYSGLTKYVTYIDGPFYDYNTVLEPNDDVAHVKLGGSWRMPTDEEWTELREECTWIWTTQNGVIGRKVTGPNGNSIFIPAAGILDGTYLGGAGSHGCYWSSSLSTDRPDSAWGVNFDSGSARRGYDYRYYGRTVRAVS